MSRRISRRSASQRVVEHTHPRHTHSHACTAAAHAQNHGHTHVRAGSHTGTRLRSSFNLCQSVMGRSQLPVCRLLRKRHVHGPFGQRAPSQSWTKSLIPPRRRRRRKRSPRGLLRRGPRPRRRPRQPSRTRMQRTRAMALQSLRCHPMRVGRPHAVRMHVPTPMLLSTRGRCFARSWHARTHTRTASHCSLSKSRWWCVRLSRASPRKGGRQQTETSRAVPRRSAPQRTVERTQPGHTDTHSHPCAAADSDTRARARSQDPTNTHTFNECAWGMHARPQTRTPTHTHTHTQARTYHTHARARMTTPTCVRAAKAARSLSRA